MTTHQYSLAQRGRRAAVLVGGFALCSVLSSAVALGLPYTGTWAFVSNFGFSALTVLPFILGASIVIAIQSFRHDRFRCGTSVATALVAVLVGAVVTGIVGAALLPSIDAAVFLGAAVVIAVIAPIPVVLGALFARWVESRACRTWGSAEPV